MNLTHITPLFYAVVLERGCGRYRVKAILNSLSL